MTQPSGSSTHPCRAALSAVALELIAAIGTARFSGLAPGAKVDAGLLARIDASEAPDDGESMALVDSGLLEKSELGLAVARAGIGVHFLAFS